MKELIGMGSIAAVNHLMDNVPKWSETLQKSGQKYFKNLAANAAIFLKYVNHFETFYSKSVFHW